MARPVGGDLPNWLDDGVVQHDWAVPRQPGPAHLMAARSLRRLTTTIDPSAIHLHSAAAGLSGRLAVRGRIPTIFQPHAWSFLAATGPQRRLALVWERFATRWTDVTIAVSHGEAAQGRQAGVAGRLEVIPNGVDADVWPMVDDAGRQTARLTLGLDRGPHVVCVGRLSVQKGQDLLLAAWPRVTNVVADATLHLVGDDQGLSLPDVAGVVVHGARQDVAAWYAVADLVTLPSRWEGLSLTLLEAMSTGRAIVASTADGCREVLHHCPAALTNIHDPDVLAEALLQRLVHPDLAAREAASHRAHVVTNYSLATTLERATAMTLTLI